MRTPWIKICGLGERAAVEAAVNAGADAIGFVFAPSPRRIDAGLARELKTLLPGSVATVAVMQHPDPETAARVLEIVRPDYLQTDAADFEYLELPADCRPLPVYRNDSDIPENAGRFLFEGPVSGAGALSDWRVAVELGSRGQLVLAGGLSAGNIADAVRAVRPFGVDVSSGVEFAPGKKDPERITAFIRAARSVELDDKPEANAR